jgi:RNA polymerase-interacting CarD/CdnL/TRCF family regulator
MYNIGDKVVYGKAGVCTVLDICEMPYGIEGMDGLCYKLQPLYDEQNTIFIPTSKEKSTMRDLITKDKADYVIKHMNNYPALFPKDEKERRSLIKETLDSDDMSKWVQLLKGLYNEKLRRNHYKKDLKYNDEKTFNFLENFIFGELSASLGVTKSEVFEYIRKNSEQGGAEQ